MRGILQINGQKDVLAIVLIMKQSGRTYLRDLMNRGLSQKTCYRALKLLLELGLVKKTIVEEEGTGGMKKVYWLTADGKALAEHIMVIDNLLEHAARRKEKEEVRKPKVPG